MSKHQITVLPDGKSKREVKPHFKGGADKPADEKKDDKKEAKPSKKSERR